MRTSTRMFAGAATLALALGGTALAATAGQGPGPGRPDVDDRPAVTSTVTGTVDGTTAEHIAYTREEERMARDLYTALDEHYGGLTPFSNIKVAEQRHHDAAGRLLTSYGLDDPSEGLAAGTFAYQDLQALYDGWLERGLTSKEEAFQVGIELESADIEDLAGMIEDVDDARVDRVLGNLLNGSEHHLAAFEAAAEGRTPGECDGECDGTGPHGPGNGMQQGPRQGVGQQGQAPGQQFQSPGKDGNAPGQRFQAPGRQRMAPGQQNQQGQQGHGPRQGFGPGDGSGDCPYADPADTDG